MPRAIRPIILQGDTALVPLSKGLFATIDAADVALVEGRNWHAAQDGPRVYAYSNCKRVDGVRPSPIGMHKLLMGSVPGLKVDHRDNDGLNNRRSNLRFSTTAQNGANARLSARNKSGVKGVHWHSRDKRWRAQIGVEGKLIPLGQFKSKDDAAKAYLEASERYHGEFRRIP